MNEISEGRTMDIMTLIHEQLSAAERAVDQQRFELAQALATIAAARALADIANALRDDYGNNPAHILHNMSYTLDQITRRLSGNSDEPSVSLTQLRADVDWLQRHVERN